MDEDKKRISTEGGEKHISAGVIIRDRGRYLLIDRAKFPPGYACPAGHVDKGEKPEEAAARELKEETGLDTNMLKLVLREYVPWNMCNRGIKGHEWYVYECEWEGELIINRKEAKGWGWYSPDEMKSLTLEKVWDYFFRKLGILK
jgi:8-oxo-dGTP pyrophosphatase MutT (NUDIX family)